jgi:hypothetical protein
MQAHVVLFGSVALRRVYCGPCESFALVRKDGTLCCCDSKIPADLEYRKIKRVVEPEQVRRLPPVQERRLILQEQENRCLYCERQFGTSVFRKQKWVKLKLHWDHMVPFSYQQNNSVSNYAAACHLCNLFKSAMIFQTLEEARIYLQAAWEKENNTEQKCAQTPIVASNSRQIGIGSDTVALPVVPLIGTGATPGFTR